MNNILEHIIKSVLLEDRIVAKTGDRLNNKEYADAKAAGAKHTFTVLVKGTSSAAQILDAAVRAISKSQQGESEKRIGVGEQSQFANGQFVYVISNPQSKERQNLIVSIFSNPGIPRKNDVGKKDSEKKPEPEVKTTDTTDIKKTQDTKEITVKAPLKIRYIGQSPLLTVSQYEQQLKSLNKSTDAITVLKTITPEQESINTYPLLWKDITNVTWMVYTLPSDKFVYIKTGNSWFSCKKTKFEEEKDTADAGDLFEERITDSEIISNLNKLQPESGYPSYSTTPASDKSTPGQVISPAGTLNTPNATYPFTYKHDKIEYTIYTMSPTDEYVYFKVGNKWYYFDKIKFEKDDFYKQLFANIEKSNFNINTLTPLNAAGIKNVETKFNLQPSKSNTETPIQPKIEIPKQIKPGTVLQFKNNPGAKIAVYQNNNGVFKPLIKNGKPQAWTISSDWKTNKSEQLRYVKSSSNSQYFLVKTADGTQFWIKSNSFK